RYIWRYEYDCTKNPDESYSTELRDIKDVRLCQFYPKTFKFIRIHNSPKDAALFLETQCNDGKKKNKVYITSCARCESHTAYKFVWRYLRDCKKNIDGSYQMDPNYKLIPRGSRRSKSNLND